MVLAWFPITSFWNPACYIRGLIQGTGRGVPNGNHFYRHSFPGADSSRAVVNYWWKDVHLVLVNRLGSLPRNSVVRLTDRLGMTIVVDWDVKPQIVQNKIWTVNAFLMTPRLFVEYLHEISQCFSASFRGETMVCANLRGVFSANVRVLRFCSRSEREKKRVFSLGWSVYLEHIK